MICRNIPICCRFAVFYAGPDVSGLAAGLLCQRVAGSCRDVGVACVLLVRVAGLLSVVVVDCAGFVRCGVVL